MVNSPEKQLEEFLASKPEWMRRMFQAGYDSLTKGELLELSRNHEEVSRLADEYALLLQQIPAKSKAYRARVRRDFGPFARLMLPPTPSGRPRKDAVAQEAVELQQRGMNSPQIAAELNKRHGEGTTTSAAIPKLIKRYLARTKSSA